MIWSKIFADGGIPSSRWGSTVTRIKQKSYNQSTKNTDDINTYNVLTNIWKKEKVSIKRSHHISIPLFDRYILINGGYFFMDKQMKPCEPFTIYDTESERVFQPVFTKDVKIPTLMYHSWCFTNEEHTQILIYGGCLVDSKELNNKTYMVDIKLGNTEKDKKEEEEDDDDEDNSIIKLEIYEVQTPESPKPFIFSTLTYYPEFSCCVLIGGCDLDYKTFNEDIWLFTYDNKLKIYTWIKIESDNESYYKPKWGNTAEYVDCKIYLFGGLMDITSTYTDSNEVAVISLTKKEKKKKNKKEKKNKKKKSKQSDEEEEEEEEEEEDPPIIYSCSVDIGGSLNPDVRRGHCSVNYSNGFYIFGGFNNNGFYNDFWYFGNRKKVAKSDELMNIIEYERKNQIAQCEYENIDDEKVIEILENEDIRYDMIGCLTNDDLVRLANKYNKEVKDLKYALNIDESVTLYKYDLLFENEEIYKYVKENEYSIERAQDVIKNMKISGLKLSVDLFKDYFVDKGKFKKIEKSEKELVDLNRRLEKMKKISCKKCEKNIICYCTVPCGCYYYCEKCANELKGKKCLVCGEDVENSLKLFFSEVD